MTAAAVADAELLEEQARLLELIATGASPTVVLDELIAGVERFLPGSRCSVLLFDARSGTLHHGAAPRLPVGYCEAIDGMSIGPAAGSCGTAAHTGQTVVARDLLTDPRWEDFRHLVVRYGMRACWSSPISSPDGRLLGTFAVYHDSPHEPHDGEIELLEQFTHLAGVGIRHAELYRRVVESEERFRRSFDDNAAAMALVRPDGTVAEANAAFARLVGRAVEDVRESPFASLVAEEEPCSGWAAATERLRTGHGQASLALHFAHPDDGAVHALGAVSVVHGSMGSPSRYCVSLVDVTQRERAEHERRGRLAANAARMAAEQASVAKGAFLAAMSHELRTPLTSIVGYSELLVALDLAPERRSAAITAISAAASHVLAIVDDVLDLAKIEAGTVTIDRQPVELAAVAACAISLLRPEADKRAVRVTVDDLTGVWLVADQRRVRQTLLNVVGNAVKYNRAGGSVRISAATTARRGFVVIDVVDDGNGIPVSLRDRLFTPFARGGDGSNDAEGSGLGLTVSRQLVASMGGELTASDNASCGTTVRIVLPAARHHPISNRTTNQSQGAQP